MSETFINNLVWGYFYDQSFIELLMYMLRFSISINEDFPLQSNNPIQSNKY